MIYVAVECNSGTVYLYIDYNLLLVKYNNHYRNYYIGIISFKNIQVR